MSIGPLKLLIKAVDTPAVHGGTALMLCTEDGVALGKQSAVRVDTEAGEMGTITVRFLIDGDTVRFADKDG